MLFAHPAKIAAIELALKWKEQSESRTRSAFTLPVSRSGLVRVGPWEEEILVNPLGLGPGKLREFTFLSSRSKRKGIKQRRWARKQLIGAYQSLSVLVGWVGLQAGLASYPCSQTGIGFSPVSGRFRVSIGYWQPLLVVRATILLSYHWRGLTPPSVLTRLVSLTQFAYLLMKPYSSYSNRAQSTHVSYFISQRRRTWQPHQ